MLPQELENRALRIKRLEMQLAIQSDKMVALKSEMNSVKVLPIAFYCLLLPTISYTHYPCITLNVLFSMCYKPHYPQAPLATHYHIHCDYSEWHRLLNCFLFNTSFVSCPLFDEGGVKNFQRIGLDACIRR